MGRRSPSARKHRALKFLAHLWQYRTYGPLIGPKEAHQPDPRWDAAEAQLVLDVARIFPHEEGQEMWWASYMRRSPAQREELVADLRRRVERDLHTS